MNKWLKTLASVAPTLAATIGGPLAGVAVKMATDALGVGNSEQELQDIVLSGDPNVLLKLKEVEANLKIKLEELGIELEKVHSEDIQSARDLAKKDMRPQVILSTLYTIGYFIVMWQFLTGTTVIPVENTTALNMLLGVLTAAQVQIMNFWFGSSHGSKTKDKQ